jgi:UDP-glucose 4-epimerase
MRNYLVTGGAGFIGSHLIDRLMQPDANVIVVDNLSTGKFENIRHHSEKPNFVFKCFDVSQSNLLEDYIWQSDVVFHFAAKVGVMYSVMNPIDTIKNNIKASETVIELCHKHKKKLILASTSEVYGKNFDTPASESHSLSIGHPMYSRWAYSASKIIDEFLAMSYVSKGLDLIIIRLFNIIGKRQNGAYGMVIPRFISQAQQDLPITVYGSGSQMRCFCDIRDLVDCLMVLIDYCPNHERIFNIGSTNEISINNLADLIKKLTGSESKIIHIPVEELPPGFEEIPRRCPNTELIQNAIGYSPKYSLDNTISFIINESKFSG